MKKIINYCPHDVTVFTGAIYDPSIGKYRGGNATVNFPSSGIVATATSSIKPCEPMECSGVNIPMCNREFANCTKIPDDDNLYIVSSVFAEACKALGCKFLDRLLTPYGLVVNDHGRTTGCVGMISYGQ